MKKRYTDIYMSPNELYDFYYFKSILDILEYETRYSMLFRVCFKSSQSFRMLGNQINFEFLNLAEKEDFVKHIHNNMILRLETSMLGYNYDGEDIIAIQLLVYKMNYTDKIVKKKDSIFNFIKKGITKSTTNVTKRKLDLGYNKLLPLSMDLKTYKNKLLVTEGKELAKLVFINGRWLDINKLISEKNNNFINDYTNLPLKDNILFYSDMENKYIIMVDVNTDSKEMLQYNIKVFTYDGTHVLSISDRHIDNNSFSRSIGNIKNIINNNKTITNTYIDIKLEPIKQSRQSYLLNNLQIANPYIGTLDVETYECNGISKVYALGVYTKQYKTNIFYIDDKTLDSDKLILNCIDSILVSKYSGYTFYVHNLGRYDIAFLLKPLIDFNNKKEDQKDKYKLQTISRDNLILSLVISKKIKSKTYTIKIVDSYNILSHKLKKLCKTYQSDTDVHKDIFPYKFIGEKTLFYVGNKPLITDYEDVDEDKDGKEKKKLYDMIPLNNWNSKTETIKYLEKDLISLYQIISKFSDYVYLKHKTQVSNSLTISSLAMKIFLSKYYVNNNIPLITKKFLYDDIKLSYFGGITEVYKPTNRENEILFYYDVNSLYPYAALNPMPGLNCKYESNINSDINNILNQFGFFYCKIKTTNDYLGLLPLRNKQGIIMPNGEWEGWYFSEELKFAANNGYKIFILKGYSFDKTYNIFDKYVKDWYKIKSTTKNSVERAVSKSFLNNLLGRFGLDINKPVTDLVNFEKYNELQQTKIINNVILINDQYLVTYVNKVSEDICYDSNVDYKNTVLNNLKNKEENESTFSDVSIAIASSVTSYARIIMNKIKLDITSKGGCIYYSDTDSIVSNIPLDKHIVGNELGQFELVFTVDKAYFISSKTYLIRDVNNKTVVKAKGINNCKLDIKDFTSLYKGLDVITKRTESYIDFRGGYVNLNVRKVTLNNNAYTKRSKIYDKGVWVDTTPLIINI